MKYGRPNTYIFVKDDNPPIQLLNYKKNMHFAVPVIYVSISATF